MSILLVHVVSSSTLRRARHREVQRAQDEEGDAVGHEQVDHREEHGREQRHAAEQHLWVYQVLYLYYMIYIPVDWNPLDQELM